MNRLLTHRPRRPAALAAAGLGIVAVVAVGAFGGSAQAATDQPAGTAAPAAPVKDHEVCSFTVDGGSGVVAVAGEAPATVDGEPVEAEPVKRGPGEAGTPVAPEGGTVRSVDDVTGAVMAEELDADALAALEKELASATQGAPLDISTVPGCGAHIVVGGPAPAAG